MLSIGINRLLVERLLGLVICASRGVLESTYQASYLWVCSKSSWGSCSGFMVWPVQETRGTLVVPHTLKMRSLLRTQNNTMPVKNGLHPFLHPLAELLRARLLSPDRDLTGPGLQNMPKCCTKVAPCLQTPSCRFDSCLTWLSVFPKPQNPKPMKP